MIKLDLTQEGLAPLTFRGEDEDGDEFEIRFEFKRRLTRQQSMTMTKTIGKGRRAKEIPDLERLYTQTVRSIHLIRGFQASYADGTPIPTDSPVEESPKIVAIMNVMPTEITDRVDSHILGSTDLEMEEKNS